MIVALIKCIFLLNLLSSLSKIRASKLEQDGPVKGILVRPPLAIIEQIRLSGEDMPGRHISAVIDTGAQATSISESLLNELGLVPRNYRPRISTEGKSDQPIYDCTVQIDFPNITEPINFHIEVGGLNLDEYGIYALIGRDILRHCELHYKGVLGKFDFSFSDDPSPKN